jgi:glycerophosphoryl diester phosphodiesterase
MLIIGHRGAAGLELENTIRSFQKAQELGVDMLECDLLRTKDGAIVLSHDTTLARVYGIDQKISQMTLTEIKEVTGKQNKEIPELSEFLAIADRPIILDIKVSGIESQVLSAIKGFAHKVLISSWNPWVLKKFRTLDTNIQLDLVWGSKFGSLILFAAALLKNTNIYSITIGPKLVTASSMARFKKLGWKVFPYPINDPAQFEGLKRLGVDGVFTDRPDIIKN